MDNTDIPEEESELDRIDNFLSQYEELSIDNMTTLFHTARRIEIEGWEIYNILPVKLC